MAEALIELTSSIREKYEASPEWQETRKKAYPDTSGAKPEKKVKKVKDKGTGFPGQGAKAVVKDEGAKAEVEVEGEGLAIRGKEEGVKEEAA